MHRRDFLRLSSAFAASVLVGSAPWRDALADRRVTRGRDDSPFGPLLPPDANGIMLPRGFRSRVLARYDEPVAGTGHPWHVFPDGGASFRAPGGHVYVSNAEAPFVGGVGAIRFDARGRVVDAYSILEGTNFNCAGGATPWGTWLSCEEYFAGLVWDCDPLGSRPGIARPALGTFSHEAVAFEPVGNAWYLTEDEPDGRLYRFRPDDYAGLERGVLEVAEMRPDHTLVWHAVPDPNPTNPTANPTRLQVPESTPFDGGEGIVYSRGHVFFTTKGDDRVWDLHPRSGRIGVLYDGRADPARTLTGVDNIAASRGGDLIVAEDGGNMELVLITRRGAVAPLLRVVGQDDSELAGPALDPWHRRLYVSSQRGGDREGGITYAIDGPFQRLRRPGRPPWRPHGRERRRRPQRRPRVQRGRA